MSLQGRRLLTVVAVASVGIGVIAAAVGYLDRKVDEQTLFGYSMRVIEADQGITNLQHVAESERLDVVTITPIPAAAAKRMVDEKVYMFGSQFERQRVGYQGQHTEYVECDPQFKPVYGEKTFAEGYLRYFTGYANNRLVPGVCDRESISHRVVYAHLYCESSRTLYQIDYFVDPNTEVEPLLDKLRCA